LGTHVAFTNFIKVLLFNFFLVFAAWLREMVILNSYRAIAKVVPKRFDLGANSWVNSGLGVSSCLERGELGSSFGLEKSFWTQRSLRRTTDELGFIYFLRQEIFKLLYPKRSDLEYLLSFRNIDGKFGGLSWRSAVLMLWPTSFSQIAPILPFLKKNFLCLGQGQIGIRRLRRGVAWLLRFWLRFFFINRWFKLLFAWIIFLKLWCSFKSLGSENSIYVLGCSKRWLLPLRAIVHCLNFNISVLLSQWLDSSQPFFRWLDWGKSHPLLQSRCLEVGFKFGINRTKITRLALWVGCSWTLLAILFFNHCYVLDILFLCCFLCLLLV